MTKAIRLACPECGEVFTRKHHRQQFCTPAHGVAFNNRQLARGQSIVNLAQAWRSARSTKDPVARAAAKEAFAQFCRAIDGYNTEDREAGRANPVKLYRARAAAGLLD